MAALRLVAVGALVAPLCAQWSFSGLDAEQQQIVTCSRNDINEDGFVGVDDLLSVLSHYHFTCEDGDFDYESCDLDIPGYEPLCGETAECPNFPAPSPAPAAEPCPEVEPCPDSSPPSPPCPAPQTCNCGGTIVAPSAELSQALFGETGCVLTPSELAAGSAAANLIAAFITQAAADLEVSEDSLVLEGTGPEGQLVNTACDAAASVVAHEVAVEVSNDLASAITEDCSMDAAEIAASPEAQALVCAMAQATAASIPGVNCNEDCSICDIVYEELAFSNSDSCSGGCTDDDATGVATAATLGLTVDGCADLVAYCTDDEYGPQMAAICPVTCGACSGSGRRQLAVEDGKTRVHLTLDDRFTAQINKVVDVVKGATDGALKEAAARRL